MLSGKTLSNIQIFYYRYEWLLPLLLLLGESILSMLIINKVPYTEIDWKAYMEQVASFLNGERDYMKIEGGTGPIVYPAGHLYIYSFLHRITNQGTDVRLAQHLFAGLYLLTQGLVFYIYRLGGVPNLFLILLCLSKRLHSIYMLRLFNDPFAMLFLYICIIFILKKKWSIASLFFSLAVSIKMNILLFSPAFCFLSLKYTGVKKSFFNGCLAALLQISLGAPFLTTHWRSYINRAFELNRVFLYKWTVNWKFLSEEQFLNQTWALLLLCATVVTYLAFGLYKYLTRHLLLKYESDICLSMFLSNLIGIVYSRTLHYQFYSWYFHQIPFLLFSSPYHILMKISLFLSIEYCWNIFPATANSSLILLCSNILLLVGTLVSLKELKEKVALKLKKN